MTAVDLDTGPKGTAGPRPAKGTVVATIPTGAGAHGVSLFPQPGRYSVGHNGVYR